ncbi:hypothetical protein INT47_000598 [Mucor saturninus]|uniref:Rab escort protein 1 n=1 Tax=Mucor saturninus TaxID=64648 RepID=A0A8H7RLY3_9FUNG|nr:hypothetical protein INT47_000598 [Mucor saturninus]
MSENLEETNFDYIVLGTGLIESILAGSLARAGKKILHLDSQQSYGGNWRVFGFRELVQWFVDMKKVMGESLIEGDLSVDYERNYASNFRNVELNLFAKNVSEEDTTTEDLCAKISDTDKDLFKSFFKDSSKATVEMKLFTELLKTSRSYNLDSTPKLLGSRDSMVETLITSGVGRYLEFKSVDDIYIYEQASNTLEKVPSSKEDVFTNKSISLVEKRKLMKFFTFAMDYDETDALLEGTENMTFVDLLQERFKITGKLGEAIIYAIAMVDDKALAKNGLQNTQKFVQSMGRFGKGAYLCPLYGGGSEIAQAFCRVCAVYGGIYILDQSLMKYTVDNETKEINGIVTKDGQEYKSGKIISGIDYLNSSWTPQDKDFGTWISRAMLVTYSPLASANIEAFTADGLSYSVFPPGSEAGNSDGPIYGIHQSQESMACPKGQYVTYLWSTSQKSDVLKKAAKLLLSKTTDETQIECVFNCFYEQRVHSTKGEGWALPKTIIPCSDPDASLNFQSASEEAEKIFRQCEPEAEFMPAGEQDPEEDY